jgi:uncharacterized membrane protein YfcA
VVELRKQLQMSPTKSQMEAEAVPLVAGQNSTFHNYFEVGEANLASFVPEEHREFVARQIQIEGLNFYWQKFGFIVVVAVLAVLVALVRGGDGLESFIGVQKCTVWDWILLAIYGLMLSSLVVYTYYVVYKEQDQKKNANWYLLDPNEPKITKSGLVGFFIYCSMVGFFSTIFGIGGGILLTPFLLKFKYMPVTTSYIITIGTLTSKIAAVLGHIVSGHLMADYTLFFGSIIVVATIFSELGALYTIERTKSQLIYPVIFISVVGISFFMNTGVGIDKWIKDTSRGISVWRYKGYC